jgi:hypothetical protein
MRVTPVSMMTSAIGVAIVARKSRCQNGGLSSFMAAVEGDFGAAEESIRQVAEYGLVLAAVGGCDRKALMQFEELNFEIVEI